jgi:hypothetical protein
VGARVATALSLLVAVGCNGDPEPAKDAEPATKPARVDPVEHARRVALASGKAPDGRRIRITAFSDAAGPCLTIRGLPRGPRQCGRAPSEEIPPGPTMRADAIAQITPESRLELYGALRPAVKRVVVRFTLPSGDHVRSASIIRVEDRSALSAAEIREPFSYFIAFVPPGARQVVAIGRNDRGRVLGRLRYDPIVNSLHPHNFIARELTRSTSR